MMNKQYPDDHHQPYLEHQHHQQQQLPRIDSQPREQLQQVHKQHQQPNQDHQYPQDPQQQQQQQQQQQDPQSPTTANSGADNASFVRLPTYIDSSLLRYYSLSDTARDTAARILWQLCESHPQITFAPTLYPIVAIFLHKHDQDYTYQTICQLLQKNHRAARDRQFKRILMPTTRLEHVRDIIVLIKLCTKFGILAPFWMRDLVRDEKRFLDNLERELGTKSNNNNSSSGNRFARGCAGCAGCASANHNDINDGDDGSTNQQNNSHDTKSRSSIRSKRAKRSSSTRQSNRSRSRHLSNGNSPSHNSHSHNNNNNDHDHNRNNNNPDIHPYNTTDCYALNDLDCNNKHHQQQHEGEEEEEEEEDLDSHICNHRHHLSTFDTPFFDWYRWIFVALPLTYCIRIIDCWLVDGQKFLYRIALAMLSRFRQQCNSPVTLSSDKMFEFCTKLESTLEPKGGVEQLIKEAKSLKRISSIKIAKASRKSESKANIIVESIMRKDSQSIRLSNHGHHSNNHHRTSIYVEQPCHDMLNNIIISSRIAPRSFKSSIVDNFDLLDDLWQYIPERAAVKTVSVVFNSNNDGTSLQTFFSRVDPYEESIIIIRTIKNEVFGSYCSSSWSLRKTQAQSAAKKSYYFGNGETFLFTLQPKFSVYLWVGKTEGDIIINDHEPPPQPQHNLNRHPSHHQESSLQNNNQSPTAPTTPTANPAALNGQTNNQTDDSTKPTGSPTKTSSNMDNQQHKLTPYIMKHRGSVTDSISTQLFMSATSQELIIGSGNGSFGLWLDADLTRGKTDHCRTFNNLPLCEDKDFTCKDVEVLAFA